MVLGIYTTEGFPERENIPRQMLQTLSPLQDLKRQQPAHYDQSIASSFFIEAWERFFYGENPEKIALKITAKALIAVILPGFDTHFFAKAKIMQDEANIIFSKVLKEEYQQKLHPELYKKLTEILPESITELYAKDDLKREDIDYQYSRKAYAFVDVLCKQPRAGATKPGVDRLLLVPPEMHSDHCLLVAVYAVLLSESFDADIGLPFLTGLAHHLHNAVLPDCGFAGETALGESLATIIRNGREEALKYIPEKSAEQIRKAINNHENLTNPEGRASSAADVLDRVLDIKWRIRAASVTEDDLLGELDLVHDGPIKNFQNQVLHSVGL